MYSITRASLGLLILCQFRALAENPEIEELTGQTKRCTYDYAYGYYGAYCANLGINKIPNLKSEIEILDFSENKLRELKTTSFAEYSSLKRLYLADNKIYHIEQNALASLTHLQSLDLSRNVITLVPPSLFQLPSLKKLHLSGNPLMQMSSTYLVSKPIRAPLEYLDLSDCALTELWNWGILPQMIYYNISLNAFTNLEVSHFVEMCNLRKLDLSKSIDKIQLCDLKPAIKWLQQRRVNYLLLDDSHLRLKSREFANCAENTIGDELNATHSLCLSSYKVPVPDNRSSGRTWARLCGGLAGFLVGFMLLLYVFHRYNVSKTKKAEKKSLPPVQGDKHTSELLLNEASSA